MEKKKLYCTLDGKEVTIGEPLDITGCSGGMCFIINIDVLTESMADLLVKQDFLKVVEKEEEKEKEIVLDEIYKIISKDVFDKKDVQAAIDLLTKLPAYSAFPMLLRAFAVYMDRKYPDHINDADVEKYFTIDMANGRVMEVPKRKIKNFKHWAAFRNLEDIKAVTKVLRPLIRNLWPK